MSIANHSSFGRGMSHFWEGRLHPITRDLYLILLDRPDLDGKTIAAFVSTAMPRAKLVRELVPFGREVSQS